MSEPKKPSRRDFFRYTGIASAVFAVPELLAACGADGEALGRLAEELDLGGLTVNETRTGLRREDMLALSFGFVNLSSSGSPPTYSRIDASKPALIVMTFPGQHVLEQGVAENGAPPPVASPLKALLANPSRLVFVLPTSITSFPASLEGVLGVCSQAGLNVNRRAAGSGDDASAPGTVSGPASPSDPLVLHDLETALELPARLIMSPGPYARFVHANLPEGGANRFELWHTRMGTSKTALGRVSMRSKRHTLRALKRRDTSDTDPFSPVPLSAKNRTDLVKITTHYGIPSPAAVQVDKLSLSALGASFELRLDAPAAVRPPGVLLERWRDRAVLGRDCYVELAFDGFCFPYGHRMSLLKVSERRFATGANPPAVLFQKYILVVKEVEKTYARNDLYGRMMPFRSVRFLTEQSPPLYNADPTKAFIAQVDDDVPFRFDCEAVDRQGRKIRFSPCIVWTPNDAAILANVPALNGKLSFLNSWFTPLGGQRVALVDPPALAPDALAGSAPDVAQSARRMRILAAAVTGQTPPYYPAMADIDLDVQAVQAITGKKEPQTFAFHERYLNHGFDAAENKNPREVYLAVPATATAAIADFSSKADKVGGLLSPSMEVAALSRISGPLSKKAASLAKKKIGEASEIFGELDPATVMPRLFGCVALTDLLELGDMEKVVPKFVTEAFTDAERFLADAQRLVAIARDFNGDKMEAYLDQLLAMAADAAEDAQAQLIQDVHDYVETELVARIQPLIDKLTLAAKTITDLKDFVEDFDEDDLEEQLETKLNALLTGLFPVDDDLLLALRSKQVAKLGQLLPVLDGPLRVAERLLTGLNELDATVGRIKAAFTAFARSVEAVRDGNVRLDWRPPVKDTLILKFEGEQNPKTNLLLSADLRVRSNGPSKAGVDLLCSLDKFYLDLAIIELHFDRLQFRQRVGKKPEIDAIFSGIEFTGCLAFVERLKDIVPLDGFSDPPNVQLTPAGLKAGFSIAIPDVAVGVFALQNITVGAQLDVPFLGDAISFRFFFSTRENPFVLQISFFGGGGYFAIELNPSGIVALEAAFEFGARLSLSFGIASGCVEVMGGFYFCWYPKEGGAELAGYLRIRGVVDVMGLISCSMELLLEMIYQTSTGKCAGSATLEFEISIGFFSKTFRKKVQRKFAGSNGDPTFVQTMAGDALPTNDAEPLPWLAYCEAFAA